MSGLDRDVVDFRNVGRDMEDHETDDTNALFIRFGLGDEAGYKTVVIEQPIIAVDRPMSKMLPEALELDDRVDVACAPYEHGLPRLPHGISESGLRPYAGEREPLLGVVANSATVPARYKSIEWILHSRSCSNDW